MKCSTLTLVSLILCATDSLANVVQVRSGEHEDFTRVALQVAEAIKYDFKVSEGNIKVRFIGDDIHLDVGFAMDRLNSGRVRSVEFNKESISLNIEMISGAHVKPVFESPYLYFDVYDALHSSLPDSSDDYSGPFIIRRSNQLDLLPSSKRLMKGYFHTGRSWGRWKQIEANLDLPLLIGLDEMAPTSARVPDFDCISEASYQSEKYIGDFIADLRSSRRVDNLEDTSKTFHRWNLVEEGNSLAGRKQENAATRASHQDVYNGDTILNFKQCNDGEISGFSQDSHEKRENGVGLPQRVVSQVGSEKLGSLSVSGKYLNGGFEEMKSGAPNSDLDSYEANKYISLDVAKSYDGLNQDFLSISLVDDKIVGDFYEDILASDDITLIYRYFSMSQISRLSPDLLSKLKKRIQGDGYSWLSAAIPDRYNDLYNGRHK